MLTFGLIWPAGLVLISRRAGVANLISVKSMLFVPQTPQDDAVIRHNNGLAVSWKLHCSSHTSEWRAVLLSETVQKAKSYLKNKSV